MNFGFRSWMLTVISCGIASSCPGWDYEGHRVVNQLAIAGLPTEFPAFVRTPAARKRIAFLGGEPDRWRNSTDLQLRHVNSPDHFIDFEDLKLVSGDLTKLSAFRYEFVVQLAEARAAHPQRFGSIDPEKNKDRTRELIGFLPWAIAESYAKLKSQFSYLKVYEELGSADEIANARANVVYVMGVMGHYVADATQPLHTTKHHNGWNGENPKGFTTARTFHAWIDGGFLAKTGGVSAASLESRLKPARLLAPNETSATEPAFAVVVTFLKAQHEKVDALYELEKTGALTGEPKTSAKGRAFIEGQMLEAAHFLGSLWLTAWREAPPDTYLRTALSKRGAANVPATD